VLFRSGSYSAKYTGFMHWRVTAKLETEDTPDLFSEEVIDALILSGTSIDTMESIAARIHVVVHTP
jgi:hypothetical protein